MTNSVHLCSHCHKYWDCGLPGCEFVGSQECPTCGRYDWENWKYVDSPTEEINSTGVDGYF